MYLSLTVIGDLCDHRQDHDIALVDFGIGDAEYKSILSNYRFQECAVHVYGRTLRGLGINLLSTPVLLVDRLARKFLAQNKLLAKTKRLLRDRAVRVGAPVEARGR
jgi:CelD/BcsL family acetyltransferase involved in cellulose biosynthesis